MHPRAIARRLASGKWRAVLPTVYTLPGVPGSWARDLTAACLWGGPGTAVSHRAAAALWGLEGCEAGVVEISTPRRVTSPRVIVHRRPSVPDEIASAAAIPVTTVARTLLDLGAVATVEKVGIAMARSLQGSTSHIPTLRSR